MIKKFIKDTFLKLTSTTCPHGYEERFFSDILKDILPNDIKKDKSGNYFYEIGNSKTVFASHIDTVSKEYKPINRVIEDNIIKTDETTNLGADDKAGMTVMLWMIKNKIPGVYYFFIGEEVGCIGSGSAALDSKTFKKFSRIISFDRRGTNSVITHQSGFRCCSDEFAKALSTQLSKGGLSYKKDPSGVYTDSAEFVDIIPECTNISVGYYKEHTNFEYQDIEHLEKLANSCLTVDWENLPTVRKLYSKNRVRATSYHRHRNNYDYVDSYTNYDYFDYFDYREERVWNKRSRKKNSSKKYIDGGYGKLIEVKATPERVGDYDERYHWIIDKLTSSEFSIDELYALRETYLDLDNPNDKWFFEYLKESVSGEFV
jgi:hypothetical protein